MLSMVSINSNSSEGNEEEGSVESKEEAESDIEMGGEDSNNNEVIKSETDQFDLKSDDDAVMSEKDAQDDVENTSVQSHDLDNAENQSTVLNSDLEEDIVMEEPLGCYQFDWSTKADLLESLMSLPLDNNDIKGILNGTLSDIIDAMIEYYPLSELKAQLIMLYKHAGLSIESLAMKNIRRKPKVEPLIK